MNIFIHILGDILWGNESALRMVFKHLKCLGVLLKTLITNVVNVECLHVLFKPPSCTLYKCIFQIHFSMHVTIYNEYFIRHIASHHFDVRKMDLLEYLFFKVCIYWLG